MIKQRTCDSVENDLSSYPTRDVQNASYQVFFVSDNDVIGTEGEIGLDPLNGPELRLTTRERTVVETMPPHKNIHYPLIENFVSAALANDPELLACPAVQASWTDWVIKQVVASQAGLS